jgi:type IV pilus assembly protein PilN
MIKINLLSEKSKKKKARRSANFLTMVGAVTLGTVVIAGAVVFLLKSEVSGLKAQSEANKALIADLNKKITEVKRYEKLNKEIEHRSSIIENLRKNQFVPVMILDEVSRAIPEGIWLAALIYREEIVTLEGNAFTNEQIVLYVENLKRIANFSDVYLEESRQVEVENVLVYRFKLNFRVRVS